jgi:hypothetical protein
MVIAGNLPFNLVDSDEFKDYVSYLHPGVNPPNRQRLRVLLDTHYEEAEKSLFPGLGSTTKVSLALDGWSSTNGHSFLGLTCYYISDDWKLKEVLLGFEEVDGSHTGWNLAQIVEKILLKHNLTHRLLAITADNASNNATLRRSLQEALQSKSVNWNAEAMSVNCLAHVLNLSAKSLLQKLGTHFYDGCGLNDAAEEEFGESDNIPVDDDEELLDEGIEHGGEVEDTVLKVSECSNILTHNFN